MKKKFLPKFRIYLTNDNKFLTNDDKFQVYRINNSEFQGLSHK